MRVEAGNELEFAQHRLNDIVFFAERTEPVENDWESYAKQLRRMVAEHARDAISALKLLK